MNKIQNLVYNIYMFESINIPSDVVWGVLILVLLVFITVSWMLHYHFRYYGVKDNPKVFAKSLFWIISILLILISFISALTYSGNI